jgi:2-oxoglutarate ferredoxin oxidoreductase subunit beta
MLSLEHGKPMLFGKERNKGIRLHGHKPEIVTIGENGISEADILVHDETDPLIAFMLAHIYWPEFPVPVGVIRRISRPTHDELMTGQIEQAVASRGKGDLAKLLASGETWTVEGDAE